MKELRDRKLIRLERDDETIFNRKLWCEFGLGPETKLYTINIEYRTTVRLFWYLIVSDSLESGTGIQNNQRLVQGLIDLIKAGKEVIEDNKKPRDRNDKKRSDKRKKNKRNKCLRQKLDL